MSLIFSESSVRGLSDSTAWRVLLARANGKPIRDIAAEMHISKRKVEALTSAGLEILKRNQDRLREIAPAHLSRELAEHFTGKEEREKDARAATLEDPRFSVEEDDYSDGNL